MSSMTPTGSGTMTVPELCAAVEQIESLIGDVATAVADPTALDLGGVPADLLAALSSRLLRAADRATAVATVTVGQVLAVAGPGTGTLIAGRYASGRRWLERDAGLAPSSAKAVIARARDLREHSEPAKAAWLAGEVSSDSVRELTSGVSGALRSVKTTRAEKERLRAEAVDVLLPVAQEGTPADVKRAVSRLRLLAESAYEEQSGDQAAVEAYDDQTLTCVQVGNLFRLEAFLTKPAAAAAMTVLDQYARSIADRDPDVPHTSDCPLAAPPAPLEPDATAFQATRWCTCGAAAAAGVVSKDNWPHMLAVGFGELMTSHLDEGRVGSHHGIAPHVTVTVDVDDLAAGLGAQLAMPGQDEPVLLTSDETRRILCDADLTTVVVEKLRDRSAASGDRGAVQPAAGEASDHDADAGSSGSDASGAATVEGDVESDIDSAVATAELTRLLMSTAVAVLYVGRTQRLVTPRQRRALEVRDKHCIFPGCRAHPRRCQAHHVREWEHDGLTDIDNLALLCVRHHISVHEGGWTITRTPGTSPYETGCWTLAPPRPQP
ncbi:MAG: DUF222 domain-containing protein [Candidatus Nanopelagicales bacterium]